MILKAFVLRSGTWRRQRYEPFMSCTVSRTEEDSVYSYPGYRETDSLYNMVRIIAGTLATGRQGQ